MPLIKSAKKKLKQDIKRTAQNKKVKEVFKKSIKKVKTSPSAKNLIEAFSAIDKTAKKNLIHENKAARLKSALSKLIAGGKPSLKKTVSKKTKTSKRKTATKQA